MLILQSTSASAVQSAERILPKWVSWSNVRNHASFISESRSLVGRTSVHWNFTSDMFAFITSPKSLKPSFKQVIALCKCLMKQGCGCCDVKIKCNCDHSVALLDTDFYFEGLCHVTTDRHNCPNAYIESLQNCETLPRSPELSNYPPEYLSVN